MRRNWFHQIRSAADAAADLAAAMRRALTERLPVVVNLPIDLLWEEVGYSPVPAAGTWPAAPEPEERAVEDAVGVIALLQLNEDVERLQRRPG